MNNDFVAAMRRAALSTRACDVTEATRIIQNALAGRNQPDIDEPASSDAVSPQSQQRPTLRLVSSDAEITEPSAELERSSVQPDAVPAADTGHFQTSQRVRRPLGETIRILREGRVMSNMFATLPGMDARAKSTTPIIPNGAHFLSRSFTCAAGTRSYKLYIPASAAEVPRGLVVMLHGCKQDPDDFAAGTNMNAVAEANGLIVAYPAQTGMANASSCWNWFNPADQVRDAGEPSIIAGITRTLMTEFSLNRQQVFVAGLSAGGAMAAVMAETYPDVYTAAGIHSGLPYRAATDVMSAFAVMRGDASSLQAAHENAAKTQSHVRMVVFQGSADTTVHSSNADRIVANATPVETHRVKQIRGRSAGGLGYLRKEFSGVDGLPLMEYWLVDGAGHAWSGGHPSGSYTDPKGPDASVEMVRFFLNQPMSKD